MVFSAVKNLFGAKPRKSELPRIPDGERYYVVGDIHGRLDLLNPLIDAIEKDDKKAGKAKSRVVLLGDLVDRGADSAGVIKRARKWQKKRKVRILAGNHEEMFLQSFDDQEVLRHFLKHGGRETILSYGLSTKKYNALTIEELFEELPKLVPLEDRDFLAGFDEKLIAGDYLFVHAGIDPHVPIEEQSRKDMLWIRDRFLSHEGPLPKVVVHGHTIFDKVMDCGNRIGVDTGAFRSGILTALVLEGKKRRTIQAVEEPDSIAIVHKDKTA